MVRGVPEAAQAIAVLDPALNAYLQGKSALGSKTLIAPLVTHALTWAVGYYGLGWDPAVTEFCRRTALCRPDGGGAVRYFDADHVAVAEAAEGCCLNTTPPHPLPLGEGVSHALKDTHTMSKSIINGQETIIRKGPLDSLIAATLGAVALLAGCSTLPSRAATTDGADLRRCHGRRQWPDRRSG